MGEPDWAPGNPGEQAMADALQRGDGAEYARQLELAPLLVPELPVPGTEAAELLTHLLPADLPCLPAFTSLESLVWVFGELAPRYQETSLALLRQQWPGPQHHLAINPGCPIGTLLTMEGLADLAAGQDGMVAAEDLQQAMADEVFAEIRRTCLPELSGRAPGEGLPQQRESGENLSRHGESGEDLSRQREVAPVNPLETALQAAISGQDGKAYLRALLDRGPVFLATAAPVAEPEAIFEDDFPWRVLDPDGAGAIAVFSSRELLVHAGGEDCPHLEVDFIRILACWPGDDYLLCVNLGTTLELVLPGETVLEVVAAMTASVGGEDPHPRD